MEISTIMTTAPVIPVLVIDHLEQAEPLAQALVAGGLPILEVTLRTPAGLAAVEAMSRVEGAIVGVGTVLQPAQFAQARDAGAQFAVTPGLTPRLAAAALGSGLALLPGVATPAELIAAQEWGFQHVKFFPAQQAGGIPMLQALAGPFPETRFCPTGGVNVANARDFLSLPNVLCVGGSWVAPKDKLAAGDWAGIEQLARAAAGLR
ncbi:MAG: bifunctional 4-hydroxy-2-oxoglutarate aldolase/2-dehydro-3-deoxy-phosphogluconate aldolase [Candidatus Competibacteraceae bacterium]|nr:bifunctional 4-hydroxy-2-oxoglutarate aldolase/2-dehydro-3-deoxy-phosphogluconate aldolase [Candidatus Competibacteraceae bacterium]MCB1804039.1 bifunctional 4-hydroxy-2-oxoglutarate aldolase/2-dehydro-3-deoxy-phosphogluconate aldolase [Candidatus Competibacteraceae bacterium]MCB1812610.1 bifunctional 4-hydroxy-2-oxoglutarate aldolase/2-dehydro-3-deoxy-phosphogluconate aldolase [Candidatus Competibacteraceae bacterium]